jgi:hypothetical protein
METILNLLQSSLAARMLLVGLVVSVPTVLSVTGLGAAYVQSLTGMDFFEMTVKFFLLVLSLGAFSGFGLLYPLERSVIRERGVHSTQWVIARVLIYASAGIPIGLIQVLAQQTLVFELTPQLRISYFVAAVAIFGLIGVAYSFSERLLAVVQRREAQLKQQIEQLKIEIDEVRRQKQVEEIVETDFFQNLKAKAAAMRAQVAEESAVST